MKLPGRVQVKVTVSSGQATVAVDVNVAAKIAIVLTIALMCLPARSSKMYTLHTFDLP